MYCTAAELNEIKAFIFVVLFLPGSLRDKGLWESAVLNSCFLIGVERTSRDEMLMTPGPVACLPID